MARRTGTADLPLHGGRVPPWLATRMATLGRVVVEALVLHHGRDEVLRRLAHPFWFQSLGAVMGMDWHSSGITTSVVGALKRGLAPVADELGLWICGGRGRHSRRTPDELAVVADKAGLDAAALARTSRLVAKVDNAAVQDGFQIYLHAFVVAADGRWTVVQQGMQGATARRYHWLSEQVRSFVEDPHSAIEGAPADRPLVNLTDARAGDARTLITGLVQHGPDRLATLVQRAQRERARQRDADAPSDSTGSDDDAPHLILPRHHDVRPKDVDPRRLHGTLAAACAAPAEDFEGLLLTPGLGPRTLESLALVAEVIHGTPTRFTDPARFALAHGGKDGHPFPVPLKVYDETLRVMRAAVQRARLGQTETLDALRRLDREARRLEAVATGQGVAAYIERERRLSPHYGGRTVFGRAGETPAPRGGRRAPRARPPARTDATPSSPQQPALPGF
ncbi:MAG: DUF763 domain-containing protein [Myxococcales bacterium]|nr:DUF763 domain-containing protein [Myxococcales bacterium]